jgi:histidine triad (HIT) family protein
VPHLRQRILTWLAKLARTNAGARFFAWSITHMDFILPLNRLYDSNTLLAFFHPQPAYPLHILIVPKQPIADMLSLQEKHSELLFECFSTAQKLVKKFELQSNGYRLIVNGGDYQDIPQIHFHLVAESFTAQDDFTHGH